MYPVRQAARGTWGEGGSLLRYSIAGLSVWLPNGFVVYPAYRVPCIALGAHPEVAAVAEHGLDCVVNLFSGGI